METSPTMLGQLTTDQCTHWLHTPVILATPLLETPPGPVGVMEGGVEVLQLVKVRGTLYNEDNSFFFLWLTIYLTSQLPAKTYPCQPMSESSTIMLSHHDLREL